MTPFEQIVRYVNQIRAQRFTTPEGRPIQVLDNTPYYGYVICDLSGKVISWLREEKNFFTYARPAGMVPMEEQY